MSPLLWSLAHGKCLTYVQGGGWFLLCACISALRPTKRAKAQCTDLCSRVCIAEESVPQRTESPVRWPSTSSAMATPRPDTKPLNLGFAMFQVNWQSFSAEAQRELTEAAGQGLSRRQVLSRFIAQVPKAELHVHIEGTLEPAMMLYLAKRNGLPAPYPSEEAARAAYNFSNLQSFLDLYYSGCSVLRTTEDFYDLTMAYLRKAAEEHVCVVEFFFDPQTHIANGVGFDVFMPGFIRATQDAKTLGVGVDARMIMSFLRHLSEEDAFSTLEKAEPWLKHYVGVGLDSAELGNPPAKFEKVMARVRELGLPVVAHAGEEGPAQYVWDTLNLLKAVRIDHGVHSLDDPALMKHLAELQMPLTVCPLSNLKLKVWDGELGLKLKQLMVGTGLAVTVNSDDPAYFDGYVSMNYEWLSDQLDLSLSQVAEMAMNSFQGSFVPQADKDIYICYVKALAEEWLKISP